MISVKIKSSHNFFYKTYNEIIKEKIKTINNTNPSHSFIIDALIKNKFQLKTFIDLTNCGTKLECGKCEACQFILFLVKKHYLRSRNKNSWKQAQSSNYNYFNKLKLFHCHLINIETYQPSKNLLQKPIYQEFKSNIVSNLYILYKETKNSQNNYEYDILFICRHPKNKEWNDFKNELSILIKK